MSLKIRELLSQSGLIDLPEHDSEELTAYGLDSLTIVMMISHLEKEFSIRIDTASFNIEHFQTIEKIEQYVRECQDPQ